MIAARHRGKAILLQQIKDRDLALLLDLGRGRGKAGIVNLNLGNAVHRAIHLLLP
ncbi:MAG: hypothetical protein P8X51_17555 [Maritimibacter sp.]